MVSTHESKQSTVIINTHRILDNRCNCPTNCIYISNFADERCTSFYILRQK